MICLGSSISTHSRTNTGISGIEAAGRAITESLHNRVAQCAASTGLRREGITEHRGKSSGYCAEVDDNDGNAQNQVQGAHGGNRLICKAGDSLEPSHNDDEQQADYHKHSGGLVEAESLIQG